MFIEPFAGGASVALAVANERLADRVVLSEIDSQVAAVWRVLLQASDGDFNRFCARVRNFELTFEIASALLSAPAEGLVAQAFKTIVANRAKRGGILAPGASLMKRGEGGKGTACRWYPETLNKRFHHVRSMRDHIDFFADDAFDVLRRYADVPDACFMVDPPYTAGGKNAGARLYSHHTLDHA